MGSARKHQSVCVERTYCNLEGQDFADRTLKSGHRRRSLSERVDAVDGVRDEESDLVAKCNVTSVLLISNADTA